MKRECPKEDHEQMAFVKWLDAKRLKYFAVPNSTRTPHFGVINKNKLLGVKKGVPDIVIPIAGVGTIYIEMKRRFAGSLSPEQREWIAHLNQVPGSKAYCFHGAEEAIDFMNKTLERKP